MRTPSLVVAAAALSLSACHLSVHGGGAYVVDGVELEEHHEEILVLDAWDPAGLTLEVSLGDVRIEPTDGPTTLVVELWEEEQGDATARYERGRLVVETRSGGPFMVGDVVVHTNGPIPALEIGTGMGDLRVDDVRVLGAASLATGMGDLDIDDTTFEGDLMASTGMGDLEIRDTKVATVHASSGMGELDLIGIRADRAVVSSGMGDVNVSGSSFDLLEVDTGMGDVDLRGASWSSLELDTGMGDVERDH